MSSLIVSFVESSNHCILASSFLVLFVSLRAYGHLVDKLEFIENGVHSCIFYDVFDVGGYVGSSLLEVLRCFDATRRPVSNKLEFAQFGAHMQKLWQFWFPVEYSCFRGSGFRMAPAVVPRYLAVVPLRSHRRQYRSAAVVLPMGPQQ